MPSRNIDDLIPELRAAAKTLIQNCRARGIEMRPYGTNRSDDEATIWIVGS